MQIRMIAFVSLILVIGCKETQDSAPQASSKACRGIYFERESGVLKKYNQYELNGQCYTDNMALTRLEYTQEAWQKNNVHCTPQNMFSSRTLISANNTYSYRNNRIWLDLDAQTGIYRRIVLSEDQNGNPTYSKLQSCFYYREAQGQDIAYGRQLLLDTAVNKIITNQTLDAAEVFKISDNGTGLNMIRWDDSADWDYRMCPYLSVPLGSNCVLLQQDGNEFFWPTLTAQQQSDLLFEAIRIGKEFNYADASKVDFNYLWDNVANARKDIDYSDQKYHVIHTTDTPLYYDQTWMQFIRYERSWMPNVSIPSL